MLCNLCPNNCNVDRSLYDGACHADNDMRICRIAPHFYEEPIISGKNGSGTIFFSGCSLDCSFCQNYAISKNKVGRVFTPSELADEIKRLEDSGVHNINLVTPTHFSNRIIETLNIYKPSIPVVYNTSGYEKPEIIKIMNDYVDVYLVDVKYANDELAFKYSRRKNYCKYNSESLQTMIDAKPVCLKEGMMQQGVIVRHLVLPEEINNSLEVIKSFMKKYRDKAYLSVMSQFTPMYESPIKRPLKRLEYKIILSELYKYDTDMCFIQELSSSGEEYVPEFTL